MNAIVSIITIVSLTDKCIKEREVAPKSADTVAASQSAESPFPSDGDSAQLDSSVPSLAEAAKPGFRKSEKHSKNALRSVSELHIGDEKLAGSSKFDMDKVLKGFGARRASGASGGTNIQAGDVPLKSSEMCPSKITIPGKKAPLDLTLKTTLQFVSSSSVKWLSYGCSLDYDIDMKTFIVIDLGLDVINSVIEPGEVLPDVIGIDLVLVGELRDHHVVGVESTFHHPLSLEDLLLHCFEPRLHASGLLGPLNITDAQHPIAHLDRLRVLQHSREVGIDDLLEELVPRSF
ncbi:hypothetical protein D1007_39666 [Hordeum vulgare]|nr:hypothetical protein D1007_39666 [Hordeum vulgare]